MITTGKYFHHLLLAFLFPITSLAAERGVALEILAEDNAAPWSQADGSGAANEVVQAAFAAAGIKTVLQIVPYARCKHMVTSGQAAACLSMSNDPALADKVAFPEQPLYRVHAQYFQHTAERLTAKRESEIPTGTRIGIVRGYEYPPSVAALAQRGVILEDAVSEIANLKKLANGRLDAAIACLDEFKSVDFLIRSAGVEQSVTPAFRGAEQNSYIGFSVKHPQGLWARDRFNEGFAKITADGTLQRILQRWRKQLQ